MNSLFNEFAPVTALQWKEQIVKDLKGVSFDQLKWKTDNGFDINPFYTSEDLKQQYAPLFTESNWDICEQISVTDEKKDNARALKALEGGASGLSFYIHKKCDLKILLNNISLEHIYTQFFISNDAIQVLDDLKNVYGKKNVHDGKIKCFINIDPLCLLAYYGEWHADQQKDLSVLKNLIHIPVNASLYQEAGANTVNELAITLCHLNEYFNYLQSEKVLKDKTIHFTFSVNGNFFPEIAKLRAIRKLVDLIQEQYATQFPIHIHAQTTQQNKSSLDAYTNMLRTTTEGMSAVLGGCSSLCVLPFNEGFESVSDFSSRISLNQQHILKEESYLNKVADVSAGSYYLESITEELASLAWEKFKELESKGGFIKCIENNTIQNIISQDADKLLGDVKEGKSVLVGVNKFQNASEKLSPFKIQAKDKTTPTFKAIKPIRLAYSFEEEKQTLSSSSIKQ